MNTLQYHNINEDLLMKNDVIFAVALNDNIELNCEHEVLICP